MPQNEEWGSIYDVALEDVEDIGHVIRNVRLFEFLSDDELHELIPLLHQRFFFPQEVIVKQGASGAGLYILLSGEAEVKLEADGEKDIQLATLGPGRMFGELSLLDGSPRAATVMSVARSRATGFFKADLMDLITHSPGVGFKIIRRLGQLVQERLNDTVKEYREFEQEIRQAKRRKHVAKSNGSGRPAPTPA